MFLSFAMSLRHGSSLVVVSSGKLGPLQSDDDDTMGNLDHDHILASVVCVCVDFVGSHGGCVCAITTVIFHDGQRYILFVLIFGRFPLLNWPILFLIMKMTILLPCLKEKHHWKP
jgi:hypothetical protein